MPGSTFKLDDDVLQVANEISRYLEQREGAADTFEGLVKWWLLRQKFAETERKVNMAVEYLCNQGVIDKRTLADGTVLYMAMPQNSEASLSNDKEISTVTKVHTKKEEK